MKLARCLLPVAFVMLLGGRASLVSSASGAAPAARTTPTTLVATTVSAAPTTPNVRTPIVPASVQLAESDRMLSRDAAALGVRDAYLRWLAPTAVIFHPEPTNAIRVYTALAPTRARFAREPWKTVVSAGGDLGWTTGPWTYKSDSSHARIDVFGDYVSVWRRQSDGIWKVMFDAGVPHPAAPREFAFEPEALPPAAHMRSALERRKSLWQVDADFARSAAERGIAAAIEHYAGDGVIVLRQGMPRLVGAAVARDSLGHREGSARMSSFAQFIGEAGDMGYTYGSFVTRGAAGPDSSHYLHIWHRGHARPWDLALEYVQAANPRGK
ncbi:MAG: hypothetical protein HYR73_04830 [Candidatus Eisenbacteria bacterium]|nr:hypothetical protein [Candidatus Eisenbacteria bacterium]